MHKTREENLWVVGKYLNRIHATNTTTSTYELTTGLCKYSLLMDFNQKLEETNSRGSPFCAPQKHTKQNQHLSHCSVIPFWLFQVRNSSTRPQSHRNRTIPNSPTSPTIPQHKTLETITQNSTTTYRNGVQQRTAYPRSTHKYPHHM